jgi:tetratricopeptide (TPR) repeat protein
VDRLDAARLKASVAVQGHFDVASAVRAYAAEFREEGIGEEAEAAEVVAGRIRSSTVREQLVAAVDDWAWQVSKGEPARLAWLLAVARSADPDPWRDRFRDAAVWQDREALERLAREAKVSELSPQILGALGLLLVIRGADAVPLLTAAQRRHPSDFWLNFGLGTVLYAAKRWEEAIGYYRAALALRPGTVVVYSNLGLALRDKGRVDEAIAEYHKAIELDPRFATARNNFGQALRDKGHLEEAFAEFKKAIELDPNFAMAHNNFGLVLRDKGRVDESIAECHKAIELDSRCAPAHTNLGAILSDVKRDYDGAIACFRKAIEFDPKLANAHYNLGNALGNKGRLDEAIAEYKKAIELDPQLAKAHTNLGNALAAKGLLDEAIAQYHKAIENDPKLALAHYNLGNALRDTGHLEEAVAEWEKTLELDPKNAYAHHNLAHWGPAAALQRQWPDFLQGRFQPRDNAQRLHLAQLCVYKRYLRAAARLYTEAFAAEPKWADDLAAQARYAAACAAALAGCGRGEDAKQLDNNERARWRRQAVDWLRADLALRSKQADSGKPTDRAEVAQILRHWQRDPDLSGLRDKGALAQLTAEERGVCEKLWADVAALVKRAGRGQLPGDGDGQ